MRETGQRSGPAALGDCERFTRRRGTRSPSTQPCAGQLSKAAAGQFLSASKNHLLQNPWEFSNFHIYIMNYKQHQFSSWKIWYLNTNDVNILKKSVHVTGRERAKHHPHDSSQQPHEVGIAPLYPWGNWGQRKRKSLTQSQTAKKQRKQDCHQLHLTPELMISVSLCCIASV